MCRDTDSELYRNQSCVSAFDEKPLGHANKQIGRLVIQDDLMMTRHASSSMVHSEETTRRDLARQGSARRGSHVPASVADLGMARRILSSY